MTETARIGERRYRLHRVARRLDPLPEQLPYYIALPPGPNGERAAGWYMRVEHGGGAPVFLGANAFAAELDLTERVQLQGARVEQRDRRRRRAS